MYKDCSTPETHYKLYDEWFACAEGVQTEQINMKGIQRNGSKFSVQKCINGQLQRWTFDTVEKPVRKRDAIFAKMSAEQMPEAPVLREDEASPPSRVQPS